MSSPIDQTLKERGGRYGKYSNVAELSQFLKRAMRHHPGWLKLSTSMQESLEMIQHKVSRILNGDPDYVDNWHDIEGYAALIEKQLTGQDP